MRITSRLAFAALAVLALTVGPARAEREFLNVSYDPTRELYKEVNEAFAKYWRASTGEPLTLRTSHGGSGKQARSVIDGLDADVVTLALGYDIDAIARIGGQIQPDWQSRFPNHSSPYNSTIVFLVRDGNPKNIRDWDDLVRPGVQVITPNPKTSGGARWNYLAAWGYAQRHDGGDEGQTRQFMRALFKNVPVLDTGARGATQTFVRRNIGDVLVAWENEAFLALEEFGSNKFEMVIPSLSILAEPPVAIVDSVVAKHRTRDIAQAYVQFLYSKVGQQLGAKHFYRPTDPEVAKANATRYPELEMLTIDADFGGWAEAQAKHFEDGGVFDDIYLK
jgi:sulfate/thiosulfate transport system substrate-binding protein